MDTVVVAARLVLAVVLAVAAVAKLVDLDSFSRANRDLGLPDRLVPVLRLGVPAFEVLLAVGLLVTPAARVAAVGAVVLLACFTGLLVWNLAHGRRPACNCFGSAAEAPIGWSSVLRNAVLLALAGLSAWSGPGLPGWIDERFSDADANVVAGVLAGALVLVGAAGFGVARSGWRPSRSDRRAADPSEPAGLPIGTPAPAVELWERVDGKLAPGVPVLVVRTDPGCGPCRALLPRLLSWQAAYAGLLEFVVVTGDLDGHDGYESVAHLLADAEPIADRLALDVTPSAVLIDAERRIGSAVAGGAVEIGALVSRAVQVEGVSHLVQGDPAGGVVLASGRGLVSIADLGGAMTLIVFWDPWCGFCQRSLLPLLQWQESARRTGPRLLVAGQRDGEVARLQGFDLVGDDLDGSVMRLFGGEGTPSAVLIDAAGRVASDIAHGQDEVMALAERCDLLTSLGASTAT